MVIAIMYQHSLAFQVVGCAHCYDVSASSTSPQYTSVLQGLTVRTTLHSPDCQGDSALTSVGMLHSDGVRVEMELIHLPYLQLDPGPVRPPAGAPCPPLAAAAGQPSQQHPTPGSALPAATHTQFFHKLCSDELA